MSNDPYQDPFERFAESYARAAQTAPFDHTAMTVTTCTPANTPAARVLLLKNFDESGFVFYTNYKSRKSQEIEQNPNVTLCFHWPWIREQIRIDGSVVKVSEAESEAYFATRPRGSQVGAWASTQSAPLESREALIQRCAEIEKQYEGKTIPRPPHWGGYRLTPSTMEFWYDGEFRLHDRFLYTLPDAASPWSFIRLNP